MDGANDTSNYFGDARGRTRVPYIFGEESVQEFQVADSPYNAAYGGAGTGFVNTVTKSGSDRFHGGAFYYNRNSGTGADDAVDHANGIKTPLNVLQQFGANLGGPVFQHKSWFFFDYEQQRQLQSISVINSALSFAKTPQGLESGPRNNVTEHSACYSFQTHFEFWRTTGRRGPDNQQALNLGILYKDTVGKKRWVLKFDDEKALEQIDAVFVTLEPNGQSHKPNGKSLLFAYLKVNPNHP